jgi:hypothetical protein
MPGKSKSFYMNFPLSGLLIGGREIFLVALRIVEEGDFRSFLSSRTVIELTFFELPVVDEIMPDP